MARSSRALFRGQLGRDIRSEQENILDKSRALGKQQRWQSILGSLGSFGGTLLASALMASNPALGLLAIASGKGLGSGLGSLAGQAIGRGVSPVEIGKSETGLLGSQYTTLEDIKQGGKEQMFGEALGSGLKTFALSGGQKYFKDLAKLKGLGATETTMDFSGLSEDASKFRGDDLKTFMSGFEKPSLRNISGLYQPQLEELLDISERGIY